MKAKIEGSLLMIELPLERKPRPSVSGKTMVIASTGGFKSSDAEFEGQKLSISVNVTVPIEQAK